jgi:hypothetical protein
MAISGRRKNTVFCKGIYEEKPLEKILSQMHDRPIHVTFAFDTLFQKKRRALHTNGEYRSQLRRDAVGNRAGIP